ncbi:hypothetical protein ERJ75_000891200 [Trypanosoma vivax]|nr:hypothetical protein ERJ75_000891200 [Trypanosoma vivax]
MERGDDLRPSESFPRSWSPRVVLVTVRVGTRRFGSSVRRSEVVSGRRSSASSNGGAGAESTAMQLCTDDPESSTDKRTAVQWAAPQTSLL